VLRVPYTTINRHGLICGATGSGKSQTTRRLLESLTTASRPIPWLVIESAKAEYAAMAGRLSDDAAVTVLRPGDPGVAPASLNPLKPEPGYPLQSHADLVRALCTAAFDAEDPFPQILARALTRVYERAGWNLVTGRLRREVRPKYRLDEPDRTARSRYPTLRDLQSAAREVVNEVGYGREVSDNVRGYIDIRIGSLRHGTPGRFFEGGHPLDTDELLCRNAVIELETITNDQDKAFLIGAILIRLVEHLRMTHARHPSDELQHVLVIEEAHRLLRNTTDGPAAAAVELFASLLAEVRAYGEGVLVVEQIPSKLLPDVIKNTALKVVHRLPARDDRDLVGASMNLTPDQSEAVVALRPGIAAVSVDGDDHPVLIGVEGGMIRESAAGARFDVPLERRRSLRCGRPCVQRACTLGELDAADRVAGAPANIIWTEAVTVSILRGEKPPRPRRHVLDAWPDEERTRTCALSILADRAANARQPGVGPWLDTDDLAGRIHDVLDAQLAEKPLPDDDLARWRAGAHRWAWLQTRLRSQVAQLDPSDDQPPHPDTGLWHDLGLHLDAPTLRGQLAQIEMDPAFSFGVEHLAAGDTTTSGLTEAVTAIGGARTLGALHRSIDHALDTDPSNGFHLDLETAFPPPRPDDAHR
jgi:hypothetical protein